MALPMPREPPVISVMGFDMGGRNYTQFVRAENYADDLAYDLAPFLFQKCRML